MDRDDVDWDDGVLTVWYSNSARAGNCGCTHHRGCAESLRRRARQAVPKPKAPSFLVSAAGTRLVYVTVQRVFSGFLRGAGIAARPGGRGPWLHDARH